MSTGKSVAEAIVATEVEARLLLLENFADRHEAFHKQADGRRWMLIVAAVSLSVTLGGMAAGALYRAGTTSATLEQTVRQVEQLSSSIDSNRTVNQEILVRLAGIESFIKYQSEMIGRRDRGRVE